MRVAMYSPAGFRRAPLLRHRRGMGDAAADYRAEAAQYTPRSVDYQFLMGCANNPTAPACAAEVKDVLAAPFVPVSAQGPIQQAIQSGGQLPTVKTINLAPTAAQLAPPQPPAPAQPIITTTGSSGGDVALQGASSVTPATPTVPPPVMTQPANAPPPVTVGPANVQQEITKAAGLTVRAGVGSVLATPILGIPLWIWGAAGVGAYFVFGQQGGHYGR